MVKLRRFQDLDDLPEFLRRQLEEAKTAEAPAAPEEPGAEQQQKDEQEEAQGDERVA